MSHKTDWLTDIIHEIIYWLFLVYVIVSLCRVYK